MMLITFCIASNLRWLLVAIFVDLTIVASRCVVCHCKFCQEFTDYKRLLQFDENRVIHS